MKSAFLFVCSIVLFVPTLVFGQQKFYYAEGQLIDSSATFDYFEERTPQANDWVYVKYFNKKSQLSWEGLYSVYTKDERTEEGMHKHYRWDNGGFWYSEEYKSGVLQELKVVYPSGKTKRIERYKNGKFKSGKCFHENGSKRKFTPFQMQPQFPGGVNKLMEFLMQNVNYPAAARENNISGKVVLTFVVEKDGAISNVTIVQRVGGGCDEEALRVVNAMPQWKPGFMDEEPVKVRYTLPIRFKLE